TSRKPCGARTTALISAADCSSAAISKGQRRGSLRYFPQRRLDSPLSRPALHGWKPDMKLSLVSFFLALACSCGLVAHTAGAAEFATYFAERTDSYDYEAQGVTSQPSPS